jgi:hypothetical protein
MAGGRSPPPKAPLAALGAWGLDHIPGLDRSANYMYGIFQRRPPQTPNGGSGCGRSAQVGVVHGVTEATIVVAVVVALGLGRIVTLCYRSSTPH